MSEVIEFRGVTRLDLDPDRVLENSKGQLKHFVIVGYDKDDEFYFSSTMANGGDVMWMFEIAKVKLLRVAGEIE